MAQFGFNGKIPTDWNRWWLAMWAITAPALVVSAFHLRFWMWVVAFLIGFLVPELVSLVKRDDSLPPLTHAIRHFLPNWVAFPLIYFSLGAVGAHWLDFDRPLHIGALMGLLGWLTDHFTVTYAATDPRPFSGTDPCAEPKANRTPA